MSPRVELYRIISRKSAIKKPCPIWGRFFCASGLVELEIHRNALFGQLVHDGLDFFAVELVFLIFLQILSAFQSHRKRKVVGARAACKIRARLDGQNLRHVKTHTQQSCRCSVKIFPAVVFEFVAYDMLNHPFPPSVRFVRNFFPGALSPRAVFPPPPL